MTRPSEHAETLRRIADRIEQRCNATMSDEERDYHLARDVVHAGTLAVAMFDDGSLNVDRIPWHKPGPGVMPRDAAKEARRVIVLAKSAKGMLKANDGFSMRAAYQAALIDLLIFDWFVRSYPSHFRMGIAPQLSIGSIEEGSGIDIMAVPKGMLAEEFRRSSPPPSGESKPTSLPICFQHYAVIESQGKHFPATRDNSVTYIEGIRLLAEQIDSAADRLGAVAVTGVREVDTAENTGASKAKPIARPTRPASVTHAARNWFNCDVRGLRKRIQRGKVRAEQQSTKLFVFDLDEVVRLNPESDADADPSLYKPKPANRRKKKPATKR